MAKQVITFGTPPTGIGGDSYRTAFGKCNENFTELYDKLAYFDGAPKAATSFTIYRDVLSNYRAAASVTGALVIHLPRAKNKSSTMLSFRIHGFNYQGNKGEWDLQVGGYNYPSGWFNCSANLNGPAPFTQVQFGMASDHQVIIIGTTSTVWAYPRFNIEELTAGYTNHETGWNTGITVEYETNLSAYTGIVTPVLYGWPQVLTAEKLTTPRTIGGVSFDGSANINLPGVNIAGNQNTSGNAATATKLATARTINGVAFDGSANITLGEPTFANPVASYSASDANALNTGGFSVRYLNQSATNKPTGTDHAVMTVNYSPLWSVQQAFDWRTGDVFTRSQNNGTWLNWATQVDTRNYATTIPTFSVNSPGLVPARVGSTTTRFLREDGTWVVPTDTTYAAMTEASANAGTETTARLITAAVLKKAIQTHAPTPTSVSGNAGTATKLQTARTINGKSFDGTANVSINTLEPELIPSGANFNNYTTPGMFFCPANATAVTLANCPTSNAFSLLVEKHAGVKQTVTEYMTSGHRTFVRNMYSGAWGPWYRMYTTADEPVGGQFIGNQATKAISYNAQNISEDVTIPGNVNALSAGPITIDDGKTVTISDGATWTIV